MNKKFKRVLSVTLALALGISSLSTSAIAAESDFSFDEAIETEAEVSGEIVSDEPVQEMYEVTSDVSGAEETVNLVEPEASDSADNTSNVESDTTETVSVYEAEAEEDTTPAEKTPAFKASLLLTGKESESVDFKTVNIQGTANQDTYMEIFFWKFDGTYPDNVEEWENYFVYSYDGIMILGYDDVLDCISLPITLANGNVSYTDARMESLNGTVYLSFMMPAGASIDTDVFVGLKNNVLYDNLHIMLQARYLDVDKNKLKVSSYLSLGWAANTFPETETVASEYYPEESEKTEFVETEEITFEDEQMLFDDEDEFEFYDDSVMIDAESYAESEDEIEQATGTIILMSGEGGSIVVSDSEDTILLEQDMFENGPIVLKCLADTSVTVQAIADDGSYPYSISISNEDGDELESYDFDDDNIFSEVSYDLDDGEVINIDVCFATEAGESQYFDDSVDQTEIVSEEEFIYQYEDDGIFTIEESDTLEDSSANGYVTFAVAEGGSLSYAKEDSSVILTSDDMNEIGILTDTVPAGEEVTLDVDSDDGYLLDNVTVYDVDGGIIAYHSGTYGEAGTEIILELSENEQVTVSAEFKYLDMQVEIETETEDESETENESDDHTVTFKSEGPGRINVYTAEYGDTCIASDSLYETVIDLDEITQDVFYVWSPVTGDGEYIGYAADDGIDVTVLNYDSGLGGAVKMKVDLSEAKGGETLTTYFDTYVDYGIKTLAVESYDFEKGGKTAIFKDIDHYAYYGRVSWYDNTTYPTPIHGTEAGKGWGDGGWLMTLPSIEWLYENLAVDGAVIPEDITYSGEGVDGEYLRMRCDGYDNPSAGAYPSSDFGGLSVGEAYVQCYDIETMGEGDSQIVVYTFVVWYLDDSSYDCQTTEGYFQLRVPTVGDARVHFAKRIADDSLITTFSKSDAEAGNATIDTALSNAENNGTDLFGNSSSLMTGVNNDDDPDIQEVDQDIRVGTTFKVFRVNSEGIKWIEKNYPDAYEDTNENKVNSYKEVTKAVYAMMQDVWSQGVNSLGSDGDSRFTLMDSLSISNSSNGLTDWFYFNVSSEEKTGYADIYVVSETDTPSALNRGWNGYSGRPDGYGNAGAIFFAAKEDKNATDYSVYYRLVQDTDGLGDITEAENSGVKIAITDTLKIYSAPVVKYLQDPDGNALAPADLGLTWEDFSWLISTSADFTDDTTITVPFSTGDPNEPTCTTTIYGLFPSQAYYVKEDPNCNAVKSGLVKGSNTVISFMIQNNGKVSYSDSYLTDVLSKDATVSAVVHDVVGISKQDGKYQFINTSITEEPVYFPIDLVAIKVGANSEPLEGAEFTLNFYEGKTSADGSPDRTWVLKSDDQGAVRMRSKDPYFASGDPFYYDNDGNVVLPIGYLTVAESKAPAGHVMIDKTISYTVTENGISPDPSDTNTLAEITFTNEEIPTPEIGTSAKDGATGDHVGDVRSNAVIVDTVTLEALSAGNSYTVTGRLMDQSTGSALMVNGQAVEQTAEITVTSSGEITAPNGESVTTTSYDATTEAVSGTIDLTFEFDASNLEDVTAVVFEILMSDGIEVTEHEDITDRDQTVHFPSVKTTARDAVTGNHSGEVSETGAIIDTVTLSNLVPGETYTVTGTLMNQSGEKLEINGQTFEQSAEIVVTGDGEITAPNGEHVTTTSSDTASGCVSGTVDLTFSLDTTSLEGASVVVFEKLLHNGVEIDHHEDITDTDQTVYYPNVKTKARDQATGTQIGRISTDDVIIDTVTLTNLAPGSGYTVTGTLMNQSGGTLEINGQTFTQTVEIEVTGDGVITAPNGETVTTTSSNLDAGQVSGTVDITFSLDSTGLEGQNIVVFEKLLQDGVEMGKHEDLTDTDQTVHYPSVRTKAKDQTTDTNIGNAGEDSAIVDTVTLTNLVPGESYTVTGTLMDQSGSTLEINGQTFTQTVEIEVTSDGDIVAPNGENVTTTDVDLSAGQVSGTVDVTFPLDSSSLEGQTIVVFEKLFYSSVEIDKHEDTADTDQTVYYPGVRTTAKDGSTGDQVGDVREDGTIIDTVILTNLVPGESYTVTGTLMDQKGNVLEINGQTFVQSAEIEVTDNGEIIAPNGEYVTTGSAAVETAQDTDGDDLESELDADSDDLETELADDNDELEAEQAENSDDPEAEQTDDSEELEAEQVNGSVDAESGLVNGSVDLTFTLDASTLEGLTVVVFEKLLYNDAEIARHEDLTDTDQYVYFPKIRTEAWDVETGDHVGTVEGNDYVYDTIYLNNLIAGEEYTVYGVLTNKITGEELLDRDGERMTEEYTFIAGDEDPIITITNYDEETGSVDCEFVLSIPIDSTDLEGETMVIIETLLHNGIAVANDYDYAMETEFETIEFPSVYTSAVDAETGNKVGAVPGEDGSAVIHDEIELSNLVADEEYTITGVLVALNESDIEEYDYMYVTSYGDLAYNKDEACLQTITFTAEDSTQSLTMDFTIESDKIQGMTICVFQDLYHNDVLVDAHPEEYSDGWHEQDLYDESVYYPALKTNATDTITDEHISDARGTRIVEDRVYFENLLIGETYTIAGELMYQSDFEDEDGIQHYAGESVTGESRSVTFVATEDLDGAAYDDESGEIAFVDSVEVTEYGTGTEAISGYVTLSFEVDESALAGATLVAFEDLYHEGTDVAPHHDLRDYPQTVKIPKVQTSAQSDGFDELSIYDENGDFADIVITDTVSYWNLWTADELITMHEQGLDLMYLDGTSRDSRTIFDINEEAVYTIKGILMDKDTEEPLTDANGETYIVYSDPFSPSESSGTYEMEFTLNGADFVVDDECILEGKSVVVFEYLYVADNPDDCTDDRETAYHEDIEDEDQDIRFPKGRTHATDTLDSADISGEEPAETVFMIHESETDTAPHEILASDSVSITDMFAFENLHGATEYTITASLQMITGYDESGNPSEWEQAYDDEGNALEMTVTLDTSEYSEEYNDSVSGYIPIVFEFSGENMAGQTLVAFETVYCEDRAVLVHADITDEAQTVAFPNIGTKASDALSGTSEMLASGTSYVLDKVTYENLENGKEYTLKAVMYDTASGLRVENADATGTFVAGAADQVITPDGTFTMSKDEIVSYLGGATTATSWDDNAKNTSYAAASARSTSGLGSGAAEFGGDINDRVDGDVYILVEFDSSWLEGYTLVAYETLYANEDNGEDKEIAEHKDRYDEDQSVNILHIGTTATVEGAKEVVGYDTIVIDDQVSYSNLTPGKTYKVRGVVMDKTTGESTNVFASEEFTPASSSGYVDVYFTVDVSQLAGHTLVVFEELETKDDEGNPHVVAEHKDLNDEDQSIIVQEYVPETPIESTPTSQIIDTPTTTYVPSESTPVTTTVKTGDDFNVVPVIVIIIVIILLIIAAIILIVRKPGNGAPNDTTAASVDIGIDDKSDVSENDADDIHDDANDITDNE